MSNFLSSILISDSFAQSTTEAAPASAGFMNFVPLVLIFLVFYFLLIRPQQKKAKEHQSTLNTLKNGDKVHTVSGILGTIKSIDTEKNIVDLEIAENVIIKILKSSIADVATKKEPAHPHAKSNKKKDNKK